MTGYPRTGPGSHEDTPDDEYGQRRTGAGPGYLGVGPVRGLPYVDRPQDVSLDVGMGTVGLNRPTEGVPPPLGRRTGGPQTRGVPDGFFTRGPSTDTKRDHSS